MDLLQLESIIKTQLSVRVPRLTNNRYPNMTFVSEVSDTTPAFPCVYVHELEPTELGNDLQNQRIHAVRATFQIEVSTNTNKADARTVTSACINAMKALRFSYVSEIYTKRDNLHTFVVRMRRVIANGDEL